MAEGRPCLHCAIRNAVLGFVGNDSKVSVEDVVRALTEVMGELIGALDIEDRELIMFQILCELPEAIVDGMPGDEDGEPEVMAAGESVH